MKLRILCHKPGQEPQWRTFSYEGEPHVTVAAALEEVNRAALDAEGEPCRVSWECSCLQKQCGACAMVINGKPALACSAFLDEIGLGDGDAVIIEPLSKFPVIEDLKVDRSVIHERIRDMGVYLEKAAVLPRGEAAGLCYDAARCLKCGLCLEVCPNYSAGSFAGPASVPESFLTVSQGGDILKSVDKLFLEGCCKCGACGRVCPEGMDTLGMIIRLARGKNTAK